MSIRNVSEYSIKQEKISLSKIDIIVGFNMIKSPIKYNK